MLIDQERAKIWQRVRDNAAATSAMVLVSYAEPWATRMEKRMARGEVFSANLLLETADTGLSGYQIGSAYQLLKLYWAHREKLVWERFLKVPTHVHSPVKKKRKNRFNRRHPARSMH